MNQLLSFLKLLVVTDKLVRGLKCVVKVLISVMTVLAAADLVKLICGACQSSKRKR